MTKAGIARLLVGGFGVGGLLVGMSLGRADVQLSGLGAVMVIFLDWLGGTTTKPYYLKPAQRPPRLSLPAAHRTYFIAIIIVAAIALFSLALVPLSIHRGLAWWCTAMASSSLVLLVFPQLSVEQHVNDHNAWLARMTPRFEDLNAE